MDTTNIFNYAHGTVDGMGAFCFVLWFAVIIAATTIVITFLTLLYKYLKGRIVISTSKIDLESEILKNLRELVKAADYGKNNSDNPPRRFIYEKTKSTYELRSEYVNDSASSSPKVT